MNRDEIVQKAMQAFEDSDARLPFDERWRAAFDAVWADLERLIAAAPELLASCEEFFPILERQLASINPAAEGSLALRCARGRVERMRAAIAKATASAGSPHAE